MSDSHPHQMELGMIHFPICEVVKNWLNVWSSLLHFFGILGFKKIWETLCTDFINYYVEILRIKLFQKDFGKTVFKLPVKSQRNWYFLQGFAAK